MREIIAVCRSSKRARERVATVLDRYFWRIGDRTWRGRASNACLDRVARELRAEAKRNTAVAIHEIRSTRQSRVPLVRIGARAAFSAEGVAPIASHAGRALRWPPRPGMERGMLAILTLAVLFHDLGKATQLFQDKLRRALKGKKAEADAVRHELHSAMVWDILFGHLADADLVEALRNLTPDAIDRACRDAASRLSAIHRNRSDPLELAFLRHEDSITFAVGMLILTHHRLPSGSENHLRLLATRHMRLDAALQDTSLRIADGAPFWHDARWLARLRRTADDLRSGQGAPGLDLALRAALMFADHLGSALKEARNSVSGHLANTKDGHPADALDLHVRRVLERLPGTFDMLHRYRDRYPALSEDQIPIDIVHPAVMEGPFAWQATTAQAARDLCSGNEGGFFACLLAGTGTGKTRAAPTILAAAALGDCRPERRFVRFSLALGLRSLASQSAAAYVDDLGFDRQDVAVLIGQPPVEFRSDAVEEADEGSESQIALPRWLRVEQATGGVPEEGTPREADWLRRLSADYDRRLPATLDLAIENAGSRGGMARRLVSSPILVGTIDHLMGVASPLTARFLFQSVRVLTSDLIIDEIDQYDPEDIAAIARLVYQAAVGGRRVIIMSATVTPDIAMALHRAYCEGWHCHAAATGAADHVNVLCGGDVPGSCATNGDGADFAAVYAASRDATLSSLAVLPPRRVGGVLSPCDTWDGLVAQIDAACDELHVATAATIDGMRVSVGFVRMTRVSHTAALAVQLPAGPQNGRLRVKLCLHSRFPRLHRAWMEHELQRALTRKDKTAPDKGLRRLCEETGLFERARTSGCREIAIVVVTSPVIETGNDLDFDWAIIDPSSLRAIVQAAGRVWRHRSYSRLAPNVFILGRSPIVMQDGELVRPGVETDRSSETKVAHPSLACFEKRFFADLAGDETFAALDARAALAPTGNVPLREAEARLRAAMLAIEDDCAPLGCYFRHRVARMNLRMTRSRMFRRSTARDLLYVQQFGDKGAEWYVDFAPGTPQGKLQPAASHGLRLREDETEHRLFPDMQERAWQAMPGDPGDPTPSDLHRLMCVAIPEYGNTEADPPMTYSIWTGFTRGKPDDLFRSFGKG